jgi:tRNA pseudouridine55 synthase
VVRDGLIVIDKPCGPTSHDVVQRVRRDLGLRRVGHGGTLDPDATGVLLVAAGQATRFFPFLSKEDKVYEGRIRLGFATDTYDASGRPLAAPCPVLPDRGTVLAAMAAFVGEILQTPPRYSAKKIGGRPVYRRARADEMFELEPVRVSIGRFVLRDYAPPDISFEAACSAGTYIRSLAHDLGQRLGCGAHLASLRRTSVGAYGLDQAVTLDAFEEAAARGEAERFIRPLDSLLPWAPGVVVRPEGQARVRNGRPLGPGHLAIPMPDRDALPGDRRGGLVRLLTPEGKLLGLARPSADGTLHPFLVIS